MPLNDILEINLSLGEPPAALADFSVPAILTTLTSPQATAFGVGRTRALTPSNWQSEMAAVGVTSSEDPYIAFRTLFSQDVKPARGIWGRRVTAVAQVATVDVVSAADGDKTVTINGIPYTFPASGSTATQIRDGLIAAINGGAEAALITATVSDPDTFLVTSDVPGLSFTITAGAGLTATVTTPNVGAGEDLAAVRLEDDTWYLLLENTRADAQHIELARAIQALDATAPKLYMGQTLDADAQGSASLIDIASRLAALSLSRAAMVWNDDIDEWIDAAIVGRVGPTPPGSNTWANQVLRNVSGIVPSNSQRLRDKDYTWLEVYAAAGFSMSQGGHVVTGTPIDLIIGKDWLRNLQQIRLAELLRNSPKVPYTNGGGQAVGDVIRGTLLQASAGPHFFIDADTIEIFVPKASAQSSTDRGNRYFPGVTWQAVAQGAIERMQITGTITA